MTAGRRIAIVHQGFVPRYRTRLFELLNAGADEYVVFYGDPPPGLGHYAASPPFAFPTEHVRHRTLRIANRTAIWQDTLSRLQTFDAIVLGTHLQFIANHAAYAYFKRRRRPVLLWGHGLEHGGDLGTGVRLIARVTNVIKASSARHADGYLAYTRGGALHVAAQGVDPTRIYVVRNSIDMEEQIALRRAAATRRESELRDSFGLSRTSTVFTYIGRVYPAKGVDRLVDAARALAGVGAPDVEVVIVGDGVALAGARDRARALRSVHFLGEVQDQERLAALLRLSTAMVIPGAVGLAINHAFAHGVPLVTQVGPDHGPELEYLEDGCNGLLVEGDADSLVAALRTLAGDRALAEVLANGALATSTRLGLDVTAADFRRAVDETLARPR